ncbi:MAG: hypothetical protein ACHQ49_05190 [Elusimicrobiota bacterium]
MRRASLSLLLVGLLSAASAGSDSAVSAAVEKRWPGSLELIRERVAEKPETKAKTGPAVDAALASAASFAAAESEGSAAAAKADSVRRFRAALEALGAERSRFLGGSGGLGVIARTVLGDAAFLEQLDGLRKLGIEPVDDAALREASARALQTFYKGRFEESRSDPDATAFVSDSGRRRRIRTTSAPRPPALDDAGKAPAAAVVPSGDEPAALRSPELAQAALAALKAAVSAVPLPASALGPAVDRLAAEIEREEKLIGASAAAVEWLNSSRDVQARDILRVFGRAAAEPASTRRAALAAALARAAALMDGSGEGREDARIRAELTTGGASSETRRKATVALLSLRDAHPAYFKARSAEAEYVRFNREHLADFPPGTRFSGAEMGMNPPPAAGWTSVEYEVAAGGRLVPTRVVSSDGSSRERGEASGTWIVRDKADRTTGWSLDAESFLGIADRAQRIRAIDSAARWLEAQGFKSGDQPGSSGALSSLLQDALSRRDAGVQAIRIYADKEKGLLSIDSDYQNGVKQKIARVEAAANGAAAGLALFERTVADPNDASTPSRKTMIYRGADQRELLTARVASNGDSAKRLVEGTVVESIPIAVHYGRDASGRWERDGATREFPQQKRVIHDSAGVVGGAGEVLGATGRGTTDLAASVLAASMALGISPGALTGNAPLVGDIQGDWFGRAKANFADNAFLASAGNYYAPGAYRDFKSALNVDDAKYVQNVRKELTDQGHPLLGAVVAAGVDTANGMVPMAAGLGAINFISPLGAAGDLAAKGVAVFWTAQASWSAGVSVKDFVHARRAYDERDPASVSDYYSAVENLTAQAEGVPVLMYGLHGGAAEEAEPRDGKVASEETAEAGGPRLEKLSIGDIGSQRLDSHPELLSKGRLRRLYEYHLQRRDIVAARVRDIVGRFAMAEPAEITSLVKGQEPSGTEPATFEKFVEGVTEKVDRKGYESLNRMTDMSRGRVNLDDFDAVKYFTLEAAKTESIADITLPADAPPDLIKQLGEILGKERVKMHKAANSDNARIHIDLIDRETNFVYELQIGTKEFNHLMQDYAVRVPKPLVPILEKIDPFGISNGLANFHLVFYDGLMALRAKRPAISDYPEMKEFMREMSAASRETGGLGAAGTKPADIKLLSAHARNLLESLYQRDPHMFDDLGHGG